jgi:hypothetical protein
VNGDFVPAGGHCFLVCHSASLRTGNYWSSKLSEHSSPKNGPRANDDLGLERMDFRRHVKFGFDEADPLGCKPKGVCFNHGERNLTPLIFYIVYVYDRAALARVAV